MEESMGPGSLEMRWLPVVDASGRARMEATWVAPQTAATTAMTAAATTPAASSTPPASATHAA